MAIFVSLTIILKNIIFKNYSGEDLLPDIFYIYIHIECVDVTTLSNKTITESINQFGLPSGQNLKDLSFSLMTDTVLHPPCW